MKQQIQLRRREVDETADLPAELPPLLRRLYASRGVRSAQELERSVKGMLPRQQLSGVEKAVEILYNAFREGTRIIVVGDFDADGATSTALSVLAMRSLGCSNIDYGSKPFRRRLRLKPGSSRSGSCPWRAVNCHGG